MPKFLDDWIKSLNAMQALEMYTYIDAVQNSEFRIMDALMDVIKTDNELYAEHFGK